MNHKIDFRYRSFIFALLMSGFTSLIVSGTIIYVRVPAHAQFIKMWLSSYAIAWPMVFAAVLIIAPQLNKLLNLFVEDK